MKIICLNNPQATDGVNMYRVMSPMNYLKNKGHEIIWLNEADKRTPDEMINIFKDCDIIYCATPTGKDTFNLIVEAVRQNLAEQTMINYGVPKEEMSKQGLSTKRLNVVLDFDDDLFEINPHNSAYIGRGRKEVVLRDENNKIMYDKNKPIYLYKDKQSYDNINALKCVFDISKNKEKLKYQIETIKLADLLCTPSKKIEKRLKRFVINGKTYLRPNGIDTDKFKNITKDKDGKIRLLWTLSESHYFDWTSLYPSIGKLMKKYDNLELVTVGSKFPITNRAIPLSKWKHISWIDGNKYGETISELKCNVGICHVKIDKFNDKKSPLKFEEYSAMGLTSLCSNYLYKMYVPDNCGIFYEDPIEFEKQLSDICEGKVNINRISNNALYYVIKNYETNKVNSELEKQLLELCK